MERSILLTILFLGGLATVAAEAQEPQIGRGRAFAQANCARCHAIGAAGESPLKGAPPFRTLHQRYPIEDIEESLAEGIVTAHPGMPQFQLEPGQIGDLIAYLQSLEG
jgi:cytochrome c